MAGPDSIRFEIADLTGLLASAGRLTDAVEHGRTTDPQVVAAITQLDRVVTRLSARYATAMLERDGGPGRQLHPLVEMAFAHLLEIPADATSHKINRLFAMLQPRSARSTEAVTEQVGEFVGRAVPAGYLERLRNGEFDRENDGHTVEVEILMALARSFGLATDYLTTTGPAAAMVAIGRDAPGPTRWAATTSGRHCPTRRSELLAPARRRPRKTAAFTKISGHPTSS
ncbi:hypothetical protein OHB12_18460 [Nocardia sp. NBC_01730]|uniref:hypothetical protein n=1 Tax=Nocardia sp. NBC_01730 TaxID=2975998 RepID=UPI002E0F5C18|nr:hypothetical protein OHB12_18460 [Nocardia sp. NBC_01730]